MLRWVKSAIKSTLARAGFRIQRLPSGVSIIDLRLLGNDPRTMLYVSSFVPVLVDAKLRFGRGLSHFPLDGRGGHPFVAAIQYGLEQPNLKCGIREVLHAYYTSAVPANGAEYLGLRGDEHPDLAGVPAWAYVLPWNTMTVEQRVAQKRNEISLNRRVRKRPDLPIGLGWKQCGPASDALIENETDRLGNLVRSIQQEGYMRGSGYGDVRATVFFESNGAWRWRVSAGEHRAARGGLG